MSAEKKSDTPVQFYQVREVHFADLIRACQLIFLPSKGISRVYADVNWEIIGIPNDVLENLKALGKEYQYSSPHVPPEIIWGKMSLETRVWFIENKDELWTIEEMFPMLDED
ncbi:hypothetical protein [Richelia intracellularis]|uniref:hypothetical protein n=1 Tax=Richelia intracellularis TaxID=1164990 RepID=UPI0003476C80|nr:hypothetical protein [Richelia intracellularis]HAE05397.1 excinuclease ATPase subunit [Richelia sp.]